MTDLTRQQSGHGDSPLHALRVVEKRVLTDDIYLFDLISADGAALPSFAAGAHLPLRLGNWLRHYSLCNAPSERDAYRIAILRAEEGRGGSRAFCDELEIGDVVHTGDPVNHFAMTEARHEAILIAGGIGITPMIAMAYEIAARQDRFTLHYAVRDASRIGFVDLLSTAPFAGNTQIHLDSASPSGHLDIDTILADASRDSHIYTCGPSAMIDAVMARAEDFGWAADRLHSERFGAVKLTALPIANKQAEAGHEHSDDSCFDVVVASTGRVIPVRPEQSIVQALSAAGVYVNVSCEQGVCGACQTSVLDGVPAHRDYILNDAERASNKVIMPCCSRSMTRSLTLDL